MWKRISIVALTVALIVAPAAVASADTVPPAGSSPSDSTVWRKWMVNLTSKVMGSAAPDSIKREQLAYLNQYSHSWEKLSSDFGIAGWHTDVNGNVVPIPPAGSGTYEDAMLQQLEQTWKNGGTAQGTGAMRVPVSKAVNLLKTVDGAALVVTSYPVGAAIGAGATDVVGGWFGFDANSAVCANYGGDLRSQDGSVVIPGGGDLIRALSGQNCGAFDLAQTYNPNADGAGYVTMSLGAAGYTLRSNLKLDGTYCGGVAGGTCGYHGVYGSTQVPTGQGYRIVITRNGTFFADMFLGPVTPAIDTAGKWLTALGTRPTVAYYNQAAVTGTFTYAIRQGGSGSGGTLISQGAVNHDDPDRTLQCDVTMTDGTVVTGVSSAFKESQGKLPQPNCPGVPFGKVPDKVTVTEKSPAAPDAKLYDQPTTPESKTWRTSYPECVTGACKLDLIQQSTQKSCFDLKDGCPDWWTDPNRSTDYQCQYGSGPANMHNVDITECAVYSGLFQPGRLAVGAPYSDPMTGDWSGGQNTPSPDQQAMGQGVRDPGLRRGCDGMNVQGFDPVGFVMRPIQCALEWAFVPRPTVVAADMAGAGEKWNGKAPAVLANFVKTGAALHPSATGCKKSVTILGTTLDVWNACDGPMATLAGVGRIVIDFAVVIAVIMVVRRQVSGMVGYHQGQ